MALNGGSLEETNGFSQKAPLSFQEKKKELLSLKELSAPVSAPKVLSRKKNTAKQEHY